VEQVAQLLLTQVNLLTENRQVLCIGTLWCNDLPMPSKYKNLAIANRSPVSCANNSSTASTSITRPWNLG